MLDPLIIDALIAFVSGGSGFALGYKVRKEADYLPGVEPKYVVGRGDRSPHVHSYDTMDGGTNGKWVCGICRKVAK